MKYLFLLVAPILISCTSNSISEVNVEEFINTVQNYQSMYVEGNENNCDKILAMVDENIEFTENGDIWTKSDMTQYCPYLPKKDVFETVSNQKLFTSELAYDFVNQLYLNQDMDKMSETTSRVWKKTGDKWKIVKMDIARYQIADSN